MSEPLPNELLIEAWKASVGASFDRCLTQRAWTGSEGRSQPTDQRRRTEGQTSKKPMERGRREVFGPKLRSSDLETPVPREGDELVAGSTLSGRSHPALGLPHPSSKTEAGLCGPPRAQDGRGGWE
jgi:hypothetical protein